MDMSLLNMHFKISLRARVRIDEVVNPKVPPRSITSLNLTFSRDTTFLFDTIFIGLISRPKRKLRIRIQNNSCPLPQSGTSMYETLSEEGHRRHRLRVVVTNELLEIAIILFLGHPPFKQIDSTLKQNSTLNNDT